MTLKDRVKALAQERGISLPALESELGLSLIHILGFQRYHTRLVLVPLEHNRPGIYRPS